MNNLLNKMERKLGRYEIPNLVVWLLAGYAIGYVCYLFSPNYLNYLSLEPYYILHGQIWRLVTWILMPPSFSSGGLGFFFILIMMYFYYQLGTALERTWGTFRFNVFIFGGMLLMVIGAFALYGVTYALYGIPYTGMGWYFSTSYINNSIFLAFAVCYPEMRVMLYFLIPIKMKWLAIVYAVIFSIEMFTPGTPAATRVAILMTLVNFVLFYYTTGKRVHLNAKQRQTRANFRRQTQETQSSQRVNPFAGNRYTPTGGKIAKHKCAICGRTELDDPNLEFRFCSKCEGNYEYCQDHLFTHQHVKR